MNDQKLIDVISAGMLGDAFGYTVEFDSWEIIQHKHGLAGLQTLKTTDGIAVASDDTQMTLFAIEGLIETLSNHDVCTDTSDHESVIAHFTDSARVSFKNWYSTQFGSWGTMCPTSMFKNTKELFNNRAPGNTCLSALSKVAQGISATNDSKGCGAVMRAAPYAFLYEIYTPKMIWKISAQSGNITHNHCDGWGSAAALSTIMAWMLNGLTLLDAIKETLPLALEHKCGGTYACLQLAVSLHATKSTPTLEGIAFTLGEGWTGDEALGIAIYCALSTNNVHDAIVMAANHDGDSDSTASIAGQLAALIHGMSEKEKEDAKSVDLYAAVVQATTALNIALSTFNK